ncbi:MAG: sulfur carrier protein ThiS [Planctomycetaceae bacterium]|nr:sulfur carrier protein ThiS [Planctomycetaceae bacterium]
MSEPEPIAIELNGRREAVARGTTIADLVARALPGARAYAVEVNRAVVSRREHASRIVSEGDRIEIVTLVGGG